MFQVTSLFHWFLFIEGEALEISILHIFFQQYSTLVHQYCTRCITEQIQEMSKHREQKNKDFDLFPYFHSLLKSKCQFLGLGQYINEYVNEYFPIVILIYAQNVAKNKWRLSLALNPLLRSVSAPAFYLKAGFHFNRTVAKRSVFHCVHIICSAWVFTKQWNTLRFATIRLKWKTGFTPLPRSVKALSHDAIFLETCNAILLLGDVKLANTSLHQSLLMYF